MQAEIRLNKFLAERMGVSRREADDLISSEKILVNGEPATIGQRVHPKDEVRYRGKVIPFKNTYVYMAMHKPVGYVSSRKRQGDTPTLYELLPDEYQHLKTVGRLDKDSSGLILLTNDGDFAYKMTHPKFAKTKIYEVELDKPLSPLHQQMIADFGVDLPDGKSQLGLEKMEKRPDDDKKAKETGGKARAAGEKPGAADRRHWRVIMHEGRNRQIRRTFAALGYTVIRLHRTQFGPYALTRLAPAKFELFQP